MSTTLPAKYTPKIAAYARGPFLEPELVEPSAWKWRDARTFTVRSAGRDWRAIRVHSAGEFIGYWAIEPVGEGME